jgi:DNA-binding transcriptional LysR family regulator
VQVRVTSANTAQIADMLIERELDLATVVGPVAGQEVEVRPWRTDELSVVSVPSHRLSSRAKVAPLALVDETFVAREPGSGTREWP